MFFGLTILKQGSNSKGSNKKTMRIVMGNNISPQFIIVSIW